MKKELLSIGLVGLLCLSSGISVTAADYGVAGCGLGSLIFKENKGGHQLLAATTNGVVSGNQTFGITTGTLGCATDGLVHKEKVQEVFVSLNFNSLEVEMAKGKGEKLEALSGLLGCSTNGTAQLGEYTKSNFDVLYTQETTPSSLLSAVKDGIRKDAALSKSCKI
ncbi:DUF3015 domain-containing protein [Leptospira selangorensis]|uniref:DUF3015 domain-containing protein n=1 Tax=Leptospira selangorensis TaxID=2484982 RepID=A0A4R9FPG3_9LEPT|nr:DUF3015 family protein [Leptospira selangorensis]TGK00404.1 DUF3015 domain-containing protein [Leptospira selangorensis]TGM17071.1 DUF3015 domain-containing protein [Leptospira selangorensis]TGM21409.1 DUF3015 domain-containing protein [Leptospira selangorensis]